MHKEYVNIVSNSNIAILFIHGILGTPNHFNMFVDVLPDDISVYNLLLDGHGKGVEDFSKTSMKKWEKQVDDIVNELCLTHKEIYIVAHSMGCLFAIDHSVKNPKISKLFLISPPMKVFLRPVIFSMMHKMYSDKIEETDVTTMALKNCCGVKQDKNIFKYIGWAPRFLELFDKIRGTRKIVDKIPSHCTVYLSLKDEMVSVKSDGYFKSNPAISIKYLEKSGHFHYEKGDLELLVNDFSGYISK